MSEPIKEKIYIITAPCWKCENEMMVAVIEGDRLKRGSSISGPEDFSFEEIEIARNNGVVIQTHFSRTRDEQYLANTCPHCKTFIGSHYLFTDYFIEAVNIRGIYLR